MVLSTRRDVKESTALSGGEAAPFTAATGIDAEVVVSIRDGYENLRSAGSDAVTVILGIDGEDPLEVGQHFLCLTASVFLFKCRVV